MNTLRAILADTRRFNRTAAVLSFLFLVLAVPATQIVRWSPADFAQYYMGAVIAREGKWELLYPIVLRTSYNPGEGDQSKLKPGNAAIADRLGVGSAARYIHPPSLALTLWPLAYLSYFHALLLWSVLLGGAMWGCAWQAGRIQAILYGNETRVAGVLMLLSSFSLMSVRTVRSGNVSSLVGLSLGCICLSIITEAAGQKRTKWPIESFGISFAFLLKFASLPMMPMLVFMRRWRALTISILSMAAWWGLTRLVAGGAVFAEWKRDIVPSLARMRPSPGNQSLAAMFARLTRGVNSVEGSDASDGRAIAMAIITLVSLWVVWRRGIRFSLAPPEFITAALSIPISLTLILGPLTWPHYYVYLVPLWGYVAWEMSHGSWRRIAGGIVIGLSLLPIVGFQWMERFPEPIGSFMLLIPVAMLCLAYARLRVVRETREEQRGFEVRV